MTVEAVCFNADHFEKRAENASSDVDFEEGDEPASLLLSGTQHDIASNPISAVTDNSWPDS